MSETFRVMSISINFKINKCLEKRNMLLEKNNNNVIIIGTINSNLPSQRISFGMSDFAEILTNLQFVTAASQIVSLK
jgi:hypothetical protein